MRESTSRSRKSHRSTSARPLNNVEVVTSVNVIAPYTLELRFADGANRTVNLEPYLDGPIFEPLRDPAFFAQVSTDPVLGTIVWPNGADFSPEFLRHAPSQEPARP